MNLKEHEHNIRSQFGEDGVIEAIFSKIGFANKICVEFGAWDGTHFSNTWNLWHNNGWRALLIEGDPEKHKVLVANTIGNSNVVPMCTFITDHGENALDPIFTKAGFPSDIDLLSIDIDGNDYYILKSLNQFVPRVIIIEYNPTIPPGIELIQKPDGYFGASALAILKLAHRKNYRLVHMTDTNMFLLNQEAFEKFGEPEQALENLFVDRHLVHLISSYDGTTLLVGNPPYAEFKTGKTRKVFPTVINPANVAIEKVIVEKIK